MAQLMCKTSLEDYVFCFIKMSNKGAAAAVHMKKYSQLYSSSEKMYGKRIMRRNCYCLLLIFFCYIGIPFNSWINFSTERKWEREREREMLLNNFRSKRKFVWKISCKVTWLQDTTNNGRWFPKFCFCMWPPSIQFYPFVLFSSCLEWK